MTMHLPPDIALNLIIALSVMIVDRVWHIPARMHPLTLYRMLVINLARKVCPARQAPVAQHYISGTLGIIVLTLPFLVVLAFILSLAEYRWFFDTLLLLVCLSFYPLRRQYKLVIQALSGNKKLLARERLSNLVARETQTLSEVGIAKAAIESYVLRFVQQYLGVLFWFLLTGPVGALAYRLLLEYRWQWHRKAARFSAFGLPAYWLTQCTLFVPYLLALLLLPLATSPLAAMQGLKNTPERDMSSLVLVLFGGGMHIQLGGPAIYGQTKYRRSRLGGSRQVRFSDLTHTLHAVNRATWLTMSLLTVLLIICWQLKL